MSFDMHVSNASGYLQLGMIREAVTELSRIDREDGRRPTVLKLKVEIHRFTEDWMAMRRCGRQLVKIEPENAQNWISYAYASRRAGGLRGARRILLQAYRIHPEEAIIPFNLSCYNSRLGCLADSRRWLLRALAAAPFCQELSLEDPDLEPLRDWFQERLC